MENTARGCWGSDVSLPFPFTVITSLMGHRENFEYTNKRNLHTNDE